MKYKIKIHYETGDSFHTEIREDFMDGTWENLDILKENLARIEEHYKWFESVHGNHYGKKELPEPDWHKGQKYPFNVLFKTDDGTEYWQSAFWCGYFETLYGASAIAQQENIGFRI